VFFVGFRSDLNHEWEPPEPTHSQDVLIWEKYITGEYWKRYGISQRDSFPSQSKLRAIEKQFGMIAPTQKAWRTVRGAIHDLPDPTKPGATKRKILNHEYRAGARSYAGHTGSPIDEPAKTIKAGDHGVPGGENMVAFPDGTVRYFTVRESARIQTFPDDYHLEGAWGEAMRQLGNAVPVHLAEVVAKSIANQLSAMESRNPSSPIKKPDLTQSESEVMLEASYG
jgi:DNA (cytosine-5)-methyltransferase 1